MTMFMVSLGFVTVATCFVVVMTLQNPDRTPPRFARQVRRAYLASRAFRTPLASLAEPHWDHIYPSFLNNSIPRPSSCARPDRSATVVCRSSSIMSSTFLAVDLMGNVQGAQPRLR